MEKALKKMGLPKDSVAMVGDNYNTDIKAGLNAGVDTILVYTGVSTRDYVSKQVHQPTHQIDQLTDWEV
jgi:4-nitrophenyl phosphatase